MQSANQFCAPYAAIGATIGALVGQSLTAGMIAASEVIDAQRICAWQRIEALANDRDAAVKENFAAIADHEDADTCLRHAAAAAGITARG